MVCAYLKQNPQAQIDSVPLYRAFLKATLADDWRLVVKDLNALQRVMPLYITLGSFDQLKMTSCIR